MERYQGICEDCGWTSAGSKTPALAERALYLHSCDKQRRADAARARGQARMAAIDRTPKPCHHKQANRITVAHDKAIRDLYDTWSMRLPPEQTHREKIAASRARNYARRAGWAPPLAYTDIDDPKEIPIMVTEHGFTRWDSLDERLWGQVEKTDTCWLWTGRLDAKGFGARIGADSEHPLRPHQAAYRLLVGAVPDGLVLDHLCRVRHCVNPAHLEPVTPEENTRRGVDARWLEDCRNGHPAPLYRKTLPSGKNVCTECRRLSDKRRDDQHRDRRRAAARSRYAAAQSSIDEVAVERAVAGDTSVQLTRAERWAAIERLNAFGMSDQQISRRLGVSDRQVLRDRQQLGLPAAIPRIIRQPGTAA